MDGLNIKKAILAGYDWGGRAACIVTLYPERCIGLISCNGYNIQNIKIDSTPQINQKMKKLLVPIFLSYKRGFNSLTKNRNDIIKFLWKTWSPTWKFSKEKSYLKKVFKTLIL